jgi:hypothetical protein
MDNFFCLYDLEISTGEQIFQLIGFKHIDVWDDTQSARDNEDGRKQVVHERLFLSQAGCR